MARLTATAFDGSLAARLRHPSGDGMLLHWLGQAGFLLDIGPRRLLIDPYLSDTLATKYAQTPYPHDRMMPAPLGIDELGPLDLVLCTHQHTDHMDPGTLAPLAERQPRLRFVVPRAARAQARERIRVGDERLITIDAGDRIEAVPGISVRAVRAAHETLERDEAGHHRFLGYSVEAQGMRLFHSGDTVPYDGQNDEIAALAADVALLPVNGRSEDLRRAGFAGNFNLDEAMALCSACAIPALIAHHYGMFAFNTTDRASIDAAVAAAPFTLLRARLQMEYRLQRE